MQTSFFSLFLHVSNRKQTYLDFSAVDNVEIVSLVAYDKKDGKYK